MFEHSVKVPQLYKTASKILKSVREDRGSVKGLLYQRKHQNIKALYSLVVECLKRYNQIEYLLKRSELLRKEPRLDPWLARILVAELLWGKRRLPGDSKPVRTVLAYHQILLAHSTDVVDADAVKPQVPKPRYVRVNTLRGSTERAIEAFRDEGWTFVRRADVGDYVEYVERLRQLGEDEFTVDAYVDDLLVFPPQTQFHGHRACTSGAIVLQDKASCVPVQILDPPPGSVVLDMCAAPGIKTTQIAARMGDQGTVYAVERDAKRFAMMNEMIELCGATCVKTLNKDVLNVTGKDLENVEYVLVDPSCTGSGIVDNSRVDEPAMANPQRVHSLAHFQIKILKHALHRFAKTKRVVYSTCSVNEQENEHVVREVLESERCFKLVPVRHLLWPDEELGDPDDVSSYCINFRPDRDLTNGFFVAAFDRLGPGETNRFFVPYSLRYNDAASEGGRDLEVLYLNESQKEKGKQGEAWKKHRNVSVIEDDNCGRKKKQKWDSSEEPWGKEHGYESGDLAQNLMADVTDNKLEKKMAQTSMEEGKLGSEILVDLNTASEEFKVVKMKKRRKKSQSGAEEKDLSTECDDILTGLKSEECSVVKIKKKKKALSDVEERKLSEESVEIVTDLNTESQECSVVKIKKKKKAQDIVEERKLSDEILSDLNTELEEFNVVKMKRKKMADRMLGDEIVTDLNTEPEECNVVKLKKKKGQRNMEERVSCNQSDEFVNTELEECNLVKLKKKKAQRNMEESSQCDEIETNLNTEFNVVKLKKKKVRGSIEELMPNSQCEDLETQSEESVVVKTKKKKKKSRESLLEDSQECDVPRKKRRKSELSLDDAEVFRRKKKRNDGDFGQDEVLGIVKKKKKKQRQEDEVQMSKSGKKKRDRTNERRVSFNTRVENFIYAPQEVDRGIGYAITPLKCGSDTRIAV